VTTGSGYHVQLFASTTADPIRWRLLSGNNREIGRGAQVYRDVETCRLAIKQLQVGLEETDAKLRRIKPSAWIWELTGNGELLAFAGHAFDRMIRCRQGLDQFSTQLVEAPVAAGLVVSNSRRWVSSRR
jgi:hypothetical protein